MKKLILQRTLQLSKRGILFPLFFIFYNSTYGTTYFVKATGNDNNSGLSDSQAWAHHPWMNNWTGTKILTPGDTVCLKRGDSWKIYFTDSPFITINQSGTVNHYITTTWYGNSGEKPLIQITGDYPHPVIAGYGKSYITIDNLEIKHFSSSQNIYNHQNGIVIGKDASNSLPHDWNITNCEIHNIPKIGIYGVDDSYNINIGNLSAHSPATTSEYSNHLYDCGYGGIVLFGRNPQSNYSNWNVYHNYIHGIDYYGGKLRDSYGITFGSGIVGYGQGFSSGWPNNCTAKYNRVEDIPCHTGIDCHGGKSIFIQNNYIFNCLHSIITQAADRDYTETAILNNVYIENNVIENPVGLNSLDHFVFISIVSENNSHRASYCYVRNNLIFYSSKRENDKDCIGISISAAENIFIEGNKILNGPTNEAGGGIVVAVNSVDEVKNITIEKNYIEGWDPGIDLFTPGITGDIYVSYNVINSPGYPLTLDGGTFSNHLNLFNNIFISSNNIPGKHCGIQLNPGNVVLASSGSISINNNIVGFAKQVSNGTYIRAPMTIIGDFSSDYNIFWNSSSSTPFIYSNTSVDLEFWVDKNLDSHSFYNVNPYFQNGSTTLSNLSDFLPQKGSPVINAGVNVNLINDFLGNPISGLPDIGAFEYQDENAQIPVLTGSSVENNTPSRIDLAFDLSLAGIMPNSSSFSIRVNSVARTVNSLTISGTKVYLTLGSPVNYGDIVTIAYSKPSSNPLQSTEGGQVASFSAQTVTNRVSAPVTPTSPAYLSSSIENLTPTKLEINFSLSLANILPSTSAFIVIVNSASRTVSSLAVSGTKLTLTLANPVAFGDIITVAYSKPSSNPLQSTEGAQVASFSAQSVSNRVSAPVTPTSPAYLSSSIENLTPTKLEINFSLSLANILPSTSAFIVIVNSASRTVSSLAVSGTKLTLTLANPVAFGDIITVAYSKPSSNPLQSTEGAQVASFSAQSVSNRVTAINNAPVVVVNSPKSIWSGFVGELNATGSYDKDKDNLSFTWTIPSYIPVSSVTGPQVKFLGPTVTETASAELTLRVSDGKTTESKTFSLEILPYEPQTEVAEIVKVEASSYYSQNLPHNIIDGNIGTIWSANGPDQWVLIELKDLFNVQFVKLAFQPGQKTESYFDILGSVDKITWEPVLEKSASCGFSGDLQVFNFPPAKAEKEFRYVKIVGLGNSKDAWNYISELKIYGYRHNNPASFKNLPVKIYPNPAFNFFNIRIDDPGLSVEYIKIINLYGKLLSMIPLDTSLRGFEVPIDLKPGIYLIQMGSVDITVHTSKLVVSAR